MHNRGARTLDACRPVGEGYYAIVSHEKGKHTHLAYVLEVPHELGKAQEIFNINHEGSFIITVKNPDVKGNAGITSLSKAEFPKHLREKFEEKKFIPIDPPDFLNYKHAQVILIAAKGNNFKIKIVFTEFKMI